MSEIPTISGSSYSSSAVDPSAWIAGGAVSVGAPVARMLDLGAMHANHLQARRLEIKDAQGGLVPPLTNALKALANQLSQEPSMARIIKVFIADPDENLPLEKRVLYSGEEKLTDLTDQELFFEVPIQELLKAHNETRKVTLDKKRTSATRDVFLEPARIRDLKMVVVTVAQF